MTSTQGKVESCQVSKSNEFYTDSTLVIRAPDALVVCRW